MKLVKETVKLQGEHVATLKDVRNEYKDLVWVFEVVHEGEKRTVEYVTPAQWTADSLLNKVLYSFGVDSSEVDTEDLINRTLVLVLNEDKVAYTKGPTKARQFLGCPMYG